MTKKKGRPKAQAHPLPGSSLSIKMLGWSEAQVEEARSRLASFEKDWDYPGMEKYDDL